MFILDYRFANYKECHSPKKKNEIVSTKGLVEGGDGAADVGSNDEPDDEAAAVAMEKKYSDGRCSATIMCGRRK